VLQRVFRIKSRTDTVLIHVIELISLEIQVLHIFFTLSGREPQNASA